MAEQTTSAERFFCPVCGSHVNGPETRHCGVRPEREVEPEWPAFWSGWYGTEGPPERGERGVNLRLKNLLAWIRWYSHSCLRNAEGKIYDRKCRVCGGRVGW